MDENTRHLLAYLVGMIMFVVILPGGGYMWRRRWISMFRRPEDMATDVAAENLQQTLDQERETTVSTPVYHALREVNYDPGVAGDITCQASGWQTRTGDPQAPGDRGGISGRFVYQGFLKGGAEQTLDVSCDLHPDGSEEAAPPAPQFTFWFSPALPENDLFAIVDARESARAVGPMSLKAGHDDAGALYLQVESPQQAWALLSLLRSGGDMILQIHADPAAPILRLPLPVGDGFEAGYLSLVGT